MTTRNTARRPLPPSPVGWPRRQGEGPRRSGPSERGPSPASLYDFALDGLGFAAVLLFLAVLAAVLS